MSERCFDCKYCNVIDGMQSCAWESGLRSSYTKCERYERDWGSTIMTFMMFVVIFIILPILLICILMMKVWF